MKLDQNDTSQGELKTEKKPWDIRPYLAVGLTAILVIFVSLLIFFFLFRFDGFSSGVGNILRSLQGVIIGLVLAYLLNPVMKFFERLFRKRLFTKGERTQKQNRTIRGLAVAAAMVVFLAVVAVLVVMIVPQLIESIQDLISTMNEKLQALTDWINRITKNTQLAGQMEDLAEQAFSWLESWILSRFQNDGTEIMSAFYNGVYSAVKLIFNIFVGLIVTVYVLMTKERFVGQAKKLIYAVFRPRTGNVVMEVLQKANDVFGGFLIGKIIDSLIIGFICFVCMYIMKLPYAVLVSVIIGVTNIIPVFGPFIGAIPSVILIFLVNPIQALYFLILVVVLQQVDGNIIGPKILGNTTGLTPFWVMFAILLFGGSFGVIGMIFGVPVFALIYYIIKRVAEHFLGKRHLPTETSDYVKLSRVNVTTNEVEVNVRTKKPVMQPLLHRIIRKKKINRDDDDNI
ncbi:MAG: AI-2E family transporter [Clostridiales bacterium]|nr:AI-2E family transporter [Clostridiales bacterium]